jgi:hypothetical protein
VLNADAAKEVWEAALQERRGSEYLKRPFYKK